MTSNSLSLLQQEILRRKLQKTEDDYVLECMKQRRIALMWKARNGKKLYM